MYSGANLIIHTPVKRSYLAGMKKKFINDISANALQVIVNQFFGLLIFYTLSAFLDKNEFGNLNWALAVLLTSFSLLSFGMEQVVVKKIAAGENASHIFSLYSTHVFIAGFSFYAILITGYFVFPFFFNQHQLLLLLGIGKLMLFLATPFKQLATGLEKFRPLMLMSVISNIIRGVALLVLAGLHRLDIFTVVIVFIAGDTIELLVAGFITSKLLKTPLLPRFNRMAYRLLVRESMPQVGVVIFTAAIARFDWILLGLLASSAILADYSFAYKVVEMSTLPLLVIAPILLPKFTKLFHGRPPASPGANMQDMYTLLSIEMIIASVTAMLLSICWVPVIDWITQGKYGAVNHTTIMLLSIGIPFLYFNNFLWTVHFASGALKMIFYIFLFTFLTNLAGDLLLIPYFGAEGAALAYILALVVQAALFLQNTVMEGMARNCISSLMVPLMALLSVLLAGFLFAQWWLVLPIAILLFALLLLATRIPTAGHRQVIKRVTGF